jgi:DNA polymerase-1
MYTTTLNVKADEEDSILFSSMQARDTSELINSCKLKTLAQLKNSMDLSWVEKKDYRIVNTEEALEEVCKELDTKKYLAVDTETTGLNIINISRNNSLRDRVVGICLSWKKDQGIYIPFEHVKFKNLNKRYTLTKLQPYLENMEIITHNGIFDGRVFYAEGIKLNIKHDTMILQFNIDGDIHRNKLGLKHLTTKLLGYSPIELEDVFEYNKDYRLFRYVDEDVVRIYACADADGTFSIFEKLITQINPVHLAGYKKDIQLAKVIMRSEYEGKYLDMTSLVKMHELFKKDASRLESIIYSYVGRELAQKITGKFGNELYKFNILSPAVLVDVCFNKLGYPAKSGKSINKAMLKYWADQKTNTPSRALTSVITDDIYSSTKDHPELGLEASDQILISKKAIYGCKYPLTYLIQAYRKVTKSIGSFFEPLIRNNFESKYFTSINMTRAATFRLIDSFQTLDSSLKTIVSPPDWAYMLGFDFAQIELRVMAGLSGDKKTIDLLDDKEADGHRVFASRILKCRPEEISSAVRKKYKAVNFGIPYGRGEGSMVDQAYGKVKKAEMKETLIEWKTGNAPIWNRLERYRDDACTPVPENEIPWHLTGKKWGRVLSPSGRARYFDLTDATESRIASIRRQSGNFPIQEYARDIFAEAVINLDKCLVDEGLIDIKVSDDYSTLGYHFENKVIFEAYIHDEVQMLIDKSINPKWMMKKIYENCVIHIPNHPTYYVGASVINNWHESKAGDHEVPIQWLEELPEDTPKFTEYDPNCQHVIDEECKQYIKTRTQNEFNRLGIDITHDCELTREKLLEFTAYYLIEKITEMFKPNRKPDKKVNYNDFFVASLEACYGITIKIIDGATKDVEVEDDTDNELLYDIFWNIIGDDNQDEEISFDDDALEDVNIMRQTSGKNLNNNFKLFQTVFKEKV